MGLKLCVWAGGDFKFVFRIVEFFGFKTSNPKFVITSSHNETISFEFAQFLNTDMIVDFTHPETKWMQVSIEENGEESEIFNIIFDQFLDHKRKECHVDFRKDQDIQNPVLDEKVYLFYEAQLIDNELEYFTELQEMSLEDREVIKNSRNDFLEIKRKLAGLFKSTSINERVRPLEDMRTLNNLQGLDTDEKIGLSRVGEKHHDIRMSFVGKVHKSSMVPVEKPTGEPKTDLYPVFPMVEEGRPSMTGRTRRGAGNGAHVVSGRAEQSHAHVEHLGQSAVLAELCGFLYESLCRVGQARVSGNDLQFALYFLVHAQGWQFVFV